MGEAMLTDAVKMPTLYTNCITKKPDTVILFQRGENLRGREMFGGGGYSEGSKP